MCGASYAFSAVGALEGAWALANGNLVKLSEQNVIDCSGKHSGTLYLHYLTNFNDSCNKKEFIFQCTVAYGNRGCRGGNMYDAFLYIVANNGIDTYDSYKYQGQVRSIHMPYHAVWLSLLCQSHVQQSSCSYSQSNRGAMMSGSIEIKSGSESALQSAVANIGPIAVAVDASSSGFRVRQLSHHHLLALYYHKDYFCIFFLTVLLFWSLQLHKMLQYYPNPCHGCYWIWHLQWS